MRNYDKMIEEIVKLTDKGSSNFDAAKKISKKHKLKKKEKKILNEKYKDMVCEQFAR